MAGASKKTNPIAETPIRRTPIQVISLPHCGTHFLHHLLTSQGADVDILAHCTGFMMEEILQDRERFANLAIPLRHPNDVAASWHKRGGYSVSWSEMWTNLRTLSQEMPCFLFWLDDRDLDRLRVWTGRPELETNWAPRGNWNGKRRAHPQHMPSPVEVDYAIEVYNGMRQRDNLDPVEPKVDIDYVKPPEVMDALNDVTALMDDPHNLHDPVIAPLRRHVEHLRLVGTPPQVGDTLMVHVPLVADKWHHEPFEVYGQTPDGTLLYRRAPGNTGHRASGPYIGPYGKPTDMTSVLDQKPEPTPEVDRSRVRDQNEAEIMFDKALFEYFKDHPDGPVPGTVLTLDDGRKMAASQDSQTGYLVWDELEE